jgi:hypothetical protein
MVDINSFNFMKHSYENFMIELRSMILQNLLPMSEYRVKKKFYSISIGSWYTASAPLPPPPVTLFLCSDRMTRPRTKISGLINLIQAWTKYVGESGIGTVDCH